MDLGHRKSLKSKRGMTKDVQDNRVMAALSYVLFLFILPLGKTNSKFCQFHAKQGIIIFIAWIVVSFLSWIPFIGWAAWVFLFVITMMAIVKTLRGEEWEIPYVSTYASKINL